MRGISKIQRQLNVCQCNFFWVQYFIQSIWQSYTNLVELNSWFTRSTRLCISFQIKIWPFWHQLTLLRN